MQTIEWTDMADVALGGAVLGAGGGGDPYIGRLMAEQSMRRQGAVKLVSIDDVDDDDLLATACMMGAPTVMLEKLPEGTEVLRAFERLGQLLGKPVKGVLCVEAGGLNSTIPFQVAAETGLPLIDGDGMGRAFPELQMVTFTLHGVSATPMVLADDKGNSVVFDTISNHWTERLARSCTVDMGGSALVAFYAMSGKTAKQALVRGTLLLAQRIGQAHRQAQKDKTDPREAIIQVTNGVRLFDARVADVERRTVGGFARGEARLIGQNDSRGDEYALSFQNEFLVLERNGETYLTTPDLITLLDQDTGQPVPAEQLRYGLRVTAIGIPSDPKWHTPGGLALVGPGYFGYDVEPRSLDTLPVRREA